MGGAESLLGVRGICVLAPLAAVPSFGGAVASKGGAGAPA